MNTQVFYALGTLVFWVGVYAFSKVVFFTIEYFFPSRYRPTRKVVPFLVLFVAMVLLYAWIPMDAGRPFREGWNLPLVWFSMPATLWLGLATLVVSGIRFTQGLSMLPKEKIAKYGGGVCFLVASMVLFSLYRKGGGTVEILRGFITLSPLFTVIGALGVVVVLLSGRWIRGSLKCMSNLPKNLAVHTTLIIGSLVFGLPFLWLVLTSLREEQDLVSEGIRWIPQVQKTDLYLDTRQPLLEGRVSGRVVQGTFISKDSSGMVTLNVLHPSSMRDRTVVVKESELKVVPKKVPMVVGTFEGQRVEGKVIRELENGQKKIQVTSPASLAGRELVVGAKDVEPLKRVGVRWENYRDALEFLPSETNYGLAYLKNTFILVVMTVVGTLLSSAIVAYAFSRLRFPGKKPLFILLLSTMMLPTAVTLLPTFLIFRSLGWIDTLYPLWVPAFFGSAFNIFLLRQFFLTVPQELEDAAKIDGCSYLKVFWSIMLPQIKPGLAVVAIWTLMGTWNNFLGPLVYLSSPENMPISYALQLFHGDHANEPSLMMAFAVMSTIPVLALFFVAQRYFIEGATLSGLGGR
jgi:multiple sugar transport system permease protein